MSEASLRVLRELFEKHLHFTPTAGDVAQFEADLAVVSPSLMRDSLLEIAATDPVHSGRAADWRDAIYKIYNRKVAELGQLFPLFHSFETAFRSTVAVTLEDHYHRADWWEPVKAAVRAGNTAKSVASITGSIYTTEAATSIYYLISDLTQKNAALVGIDSGYLLLEHATLGHIAALIEKHWSLFRPILKRNNQQLSRADFSAKFTKVQNGRNAVFHHRSFSGFTDTYSAAEDLLAYLQFPLARVHKMVMESKCAPPSYTNLIA